jgi:hypothetical protein
MSSAERASSQGTANVPATNRLADLVPLAVVIAGGCEPCAESMVRRAVENGTADHLVARTLAIVADLRLRECFAGAVGPEVVARMERPLAAARRALQELAGPCGSSGCCR